MEDKTNMLPAKGGIVPTLVDFLAVEGELLDSGYAAIHGEE